MKKMGWFVSLLIWNLILSLFAFNINKEVSNITEQNKSLSKDLSLIQESNLEMRSLLLELSEAIVLESERIDTSKVEPKNVSTEQLDKEVVQQLEIEDEIGSNSEPDNKALEEFAKRMMTDKNYDPNAIAAKNFGEQQTDFSWASSQQNNIIELFSTSPELSLIPLESVECKSSLCKVSVYSEGTNSFQVANSFAKSLDGKKWHNQNASFIFKHTAEDGLFSFYLGKDENSLNFDNDD